MSTEPFIGEIKMLGFQFQPASYQYCNGQSISIASYTALFSLLGTTYGGNGTTTFNLPDLRGRMPIGQGTGPGLPTYSIGEQAGATSVTLLSGNMPAHNHPATGITVNVPVSTGGPDASSPATAFLADNSTDAYSSVSTAGQYYGQTVVGGTTGVAGSSSPFGIANPYLVINYCIAMEGIFPSRN